MERTIKRVCLEMNVSLKDFYSKRRFRHIVDCNKLISVLLKEEGIHEQIIASLLKKDRTTILYYFREADNLIKTNPDFRKAYLRCKREKGLPNMNKEQNLKKPQNQLNTAGVITPLLTDKEIEEYIWEEIPIALSQIDIDTYSDGYIRYLDAVHWAKWGRDNCNGL